MKNVAMVIMALLFAFWGQYQFGHGYVSDALLLHAMGIVLFAFAAAGVAEFRPARVKVKTREMGKGRWTLVALGSLLVAIAVYFFAHYTATNTGLVLWLAGLTLFVCGFATVLPRPSFKISRREALILALILLVALLMRAYRLGSMPPGVYLDEADNGLWAVRFIKGSYSPFTEHRDSSATLYFYFLAFGLKILGLSVLSMRWVAVAIGMVTVLAFYFLARLLFGVRPAQLACALLAVSRWHVHFSRMAFEALLVPLFEVLTLYFLWKGLTAKSRSDFAWAGLAFGFGFHTYIGYRVFPLVIAAFLVHRLAFERGWLRQNYKNLGVFALATYMILAPLVVYVVERPDIFLRRTQAASVLNDIRREGSYAPLRANIKKSLLMFNHKGDPRPRHNLPNAPMLDFWTAIVFTLGLGYSIYSWKRPRYFLLLAWFFVGLLPSVLSLADSIPHSLRSIGNVPVVFLFVSVFWEQTWAVLEQGLRGHGLRQIMALAVIFSILSAYANCDTYFNKQATNRSVYYDFDPVQSEAGLYIKAKGETHRLLVSSALANHSAVKFIPYGVPYEDFDLNRHLPLREEVDTDVIYVLELAHASVVERLKSLYPRGISEEHQDRYNKTLFYTYLVPKEEVLSIQGLVGRYYRGTEAVDQPALERRDSSISFRWLPPLTPPFTAIWKGSLYVPSYGTYTFILDSSGSARLSIDDELLIESRGQRVQASKLLLGGFHPISVQCIQEEEEGRLKLSWITPGGQEEVIPRNALYDRQLSRFGLLGRYYPGAENWAGQPPVVRIDPFIAPNDFLHVPFSIEWAAKIYAPTAGRYLFATISDDGSFLYIDGQLVVDNGGQHGDRYVEGQIELEEGFHDIILRYFQVGGGRKIELWWVPPGGSKEQVPAEQLIPPDAPLVKPSPGPTPIPRATLLPIPVALGEAHFVTQWGGRGSGDDLFIEPRGVAVDHHGYVYVASTGDRRVQKFDAKGGFVAAWGEDLFIEPFDLVVNSRGDVYVLDAGGQAVLRFSSEGEFLGQIGADLGLYGPRGLGIDATDNLYVANTGGSRVLKLSPSGQLLAQYGTPGEGPGQMKQPTDVAVNGDGSLYVVDILNRRVQVLDPSGSFLAEWPIGGANSTDSPHIALGSSGEVYLSEPEGHRVLVYNRQGQLLSQFGGKGVGPGQFDKPIGLAVDNKGHVYVVDTYNHRIQIFKMGK